MKNAIKKTVAGIGNVFMERTRRRIGHLQEEMTSIKKMLIDDYLRKNLFENTKYSEPKKLNKREFQVYSQHGEDGIVQEIFARIGETNRFFVEFGVQDGLECNTLFLLLKNWKGCWLEGSKEHVAAIHEKFGFLIEEKKLSAKQAFISAENIEELFRSLNVPRDFDLLSIDIDGNDYWVWKAIENYSPRVVIMEYNAMFPPPTEFIVEYQADKMYDIASHFGASLKSLEILGSQKGYKLVGCEFAGSNAFFVRQDLIKDKFLEPFTAEKHYEPPRYFLTNQIGHKRDFGRFATTRH